MPLHDTLNSVAVKGYLDSLILHGIKLGLHNIRELLAVEDNPHLNYPVVHVAGTNGKGSVLTFLNAMLRQAGYTTGRFTSPHLLDVNERFLINDRPIADDELFEHLEVFRNAAESKTINPTYFEMNTAIAFRSFAHHHVDIALVEVGMGGRFDSTNIVEPEACAITSIDYDHMEHLGDTLEKIAFEKAGILKHGVPIVTGAIETGPLEIIKTQAHHVQAPLYQFCEHYHVQSEGTAFHPSMTYSGPHFNLKSIPLGLIGMHQINNAAVAVTLAGLISNKFTKLSQESVFKGLQNAHWPGRFEQVLDEPPVIMDVAHNPAGCRMIADTLPECVTIFAVSSDKDASTMLDILAPISSPLILTAFSGARSLPIDHLKKICNHPHKSFARLVDAIDAGLLLADAQRPLLITGSIYAVGEARRILIDNYGASPLVF